MRRLASLLCTSFLLLGCAPRGPVRAALHSDLPTLQRAVAQAEREGQLDSATVRELADAVARRELQSAKGQSGVRRVRSLRACARPLLPALRERSGQQDEIGAEAMLVRLAQNDVSASGLFERHRSATSGAWRAVAARAALEPRDVPSRRRWFLDPDERVRRAAFEAALAAPDPTDLDPVLEAFRLDPDPLSRSLAARVAGAIGGERSVLGLQDRFTRADEPGRLAILDAWAMKASLEHGGARELRKVAELRRGVVSVSAAQALLRTGDRDGSLVGLLLMAITHGSEVEQRLAITWIPVADARVLPALKVAAAHANAEVRVLALARLLEVPAEAPGAQRSLRAMLAKREAAAATRAALAAAGDKSIIAALRSEVKQGHPFRRPQAALALYQLGDAPGAAWALVDADAGVRTTTACGVLARSGS